MRIRDSFDGNPGIREWETQTTCDLGRRLNVNLFGMTDYLHVGESIPRPRTLIDTNDSWRAKALHTMVTKQQVSMHGMTDYFHVGRVDPKPKNAGGHERLTARESSAYDGGRTGPDGDKHVDERRHRT